MFQKLDTHRLLVSMATTGAGNQYSTENKDNYIDAVTYQKQTLGFGSWMSPKDPCVASLAHNLWPVTPLWDAEILGRENGGKNARLSSHFLGEDMRPDPTPPLPLFFALSHEASSCLCYISLPRCSVSSQAPTQRGHPATDQSLQNCEPNWPLLFFSWFISGICHSHRNLTKPVDTSSI